ECRAEAELRLGNNAIVITELCTLVDKYPYHERLRLHLMIALHRCGRRAEALDIYAKTRQLFADELGTEPGAQLRELHQALLRDAGLEVRLAAEAAGAALRAPRADLPAPAVAILAPTAVRYSLPPDTAAFTGREEELARIAASAALAGPGGV